MKLHELNAPAGARKAVTRKGRGAGSGRCPSGGTGGGLAGAAHGGMCAQGPS